MEHGGSGGSDKPFDELERGKLLLMLNKLKTAIIRFSFWLMDRMLSRCGRRPAGAWKISISIHRQSPDCGTQLTLRVSASKEQHNEAQQDP
jgi:hypothetical protein